MAARRVLIVVPCYNEKARLEIQPWLRFIAAHRDVGFIFVDDGSTDGTAAVLADLASGGGERVEVLTLTANGGKGAAVRHGMLAAFEQQPLFVGYWDADLSTPLDELDEFIDTLTLNPEVDVVMGARVQMLGYRIERRMFRHYTGRLFATAASLALGLRVYDTQCGAKLFRANDVVRDCFEDAFPSPWTMDVEILAHYVRRVGHAAAVNRIREIPLHTWKDVSGSKLRLWSSLPALWHLLRIWRLLRERAGVNADRA